MMSGHRQVHRKKRLLRRPLIDPVQKTVDSRGLVDAEEVNAELTSFLGAGTIKATASDATER